MPSRSCCGRRTCRWCLRSGRTPAPWQSSKDWPASLQLSLQQSAAPLQRWWATVSSLCRCNARRPLTEAPPFWWATLPVASGLRHALARVRGHVKVGGIQRSSQRVGGAASPVSRSCRRGVSGAVFRCPSDRLAPPMTAATMGWALHRSVARTGTCQRALPKARTAAKPWRGAATH